MTFSDTERLRALPFKTWPSLIGCDDLSSEKFLHPCLFRHCPKLSLPVEFLKRKHRGIQVFVAVNELRRLQFHYVYFITHQISSLNVLPDAFNANPSYSLNRLVRDLLPLTTMDARGETKGISIRSYPYAHCSCWNGRWRYRRCDTSFIFFRVSKIQTCFFLV